MKSVSDKLKNHLDGELTTLALLIKITRHDEAVIGLTSHDRDLVVENVTYKADGALSAFGSVKQSIYMQGNETDVSGVLDSNLISDEDIRAGHFDHARVDMFICNWKDLSASTVHLRRGWLGEVVIKDTQYHASYLPFHDLLNKKVGETYTPECRFNLGDDRCCVDRSAYEVLGYVTSMVDRRVFIDTTRSEELGYFRDGLLTWTSGKNSGVSCEVAQWSLEDTMFTLWLETPFPIEIGDTYKVCAGCDKRLSTCQSRFNNVKNYGGFPHLPGIGKILQYPE